VSGLFDDETPEGPRGNADLGRPSSGRLRAVLITAVVLVVGFLGLTGFSAFWTERLWFGSVGYAGVFSTMVWTRIALFVAFGVLMAVVVGLNMLVAFRTRPIFRPASPEQTSLDRYREVVTPIRVWLLVGVALLTGTFAGSSAAGQWREYLLWRNGVPFRDTDPYFGRDIGFYVFELPWLHFLVDFVMAAAIVSLMAAGGVHYLYGGIRLQGRGDRLSGAAQAQASVLLGVFMLAKGADYYLDRFDLLSESGALMTGLSYTDDRAVLPAKNILMGIAAICAVLFLLNVWRRTWLLPSVGLGLLVLSAILLGMIWPGIVQQFRVNPTEADKEEPYIQRNIHATRAAYKIADAKVEPFSGRADLSSLNENARRTLAQRAIDSPGIRLVDPKVVTQTFQQRQQVRGYYTVADVLDVDRYQVNGEERDVVLGIRELNQSGIAASSQNWANLATVYTHGYGVIAAYGNQRPANNQQTVQGDEPAWAEVDLPPKGQLSGLTEEGYEGRVYFGENSPTYSIVGRAAEGARNIELDLPGESGNGEDRTTTYGGADGVRIGSTFHQLLYMIKFGELNIILSERVNGNSKILYYRDPSQRVEKVAPWLTVDGDPFPAVVDERLVWMLDGYTTTDRYPLSEKESFEEMTDDSLADPTQFRTLQTDEINYMRNAVKATVDAYDGTVTLYAWDEEDPLLQAWSQAFPGTVRPRSDIPDALLEHMRYPEDLFKVQRFQLAAYHVTNARDFYEANDKWEVPSDPNDPTSLQPPYRLSVPSERAQDTFSLTSVYTPVNRENLAAFVSVDGDAADQGYGTIRIKRLGSSSQIPGPGQIANQIQSDQSVTQALLPYSRETNTQVVNGNLLTLPVGDGLLYVQPLYSLRSSGEGNFPVLRYVAVSFGQNQVGIGRTLGEAIYDVLSLSGTPSDLGGGQTTGGDRPNTPTGEPPTGSVDAQVQQLLRQAQAKFEEAEQAQREGDTVGWAEALEEAKDLVEQAIELAEQEPAREPASDATTE
jgi:uncharacterized membrane protein (UPF0182 family)